MQVIATTTRQQIQHRLAVIVVGVHFRGSWPRDADRKLLQLNVSPEQPTGCFGLKDGYYLALGTAYSFQESTELPGAVAVGVAMPPNDAHVAVVDEVVLLDQSGIGGDLQLRTRHTDPADFRQVVGTKFPELPSEGRPVMAALKAENFADEV
jgi:hypothetical protein